MHFFLEFLRLPLAAVPPTRQHVLYIVLGILALLIIGLSLLPFSRQGEHTASPPLQPRKRQATPSKGVVARLGFSIRSAMQIYHQTTAPVLKIWDVREENSPAETEHSVTGASGAFPTEPEMATAFIGPSTLERRAGVVWNPPSDGVFLSSSLGPLSRAIEEEKTDKAHFGALGLRPPGHDAAESADEAHLVSLHLRTTRPSSEPAISDEAYFGASRLFAPPVSLRVASGVQNEPHDSSAGSAEVPRSAVPPARARTSASVGTRAAAVPSEARGTPATKEAGVRGATLAHQKKTGAEAGTRLRVQGFGLAHLVVWGKRLELRSTSKQMQLILYLAHAAAEHGPREAYYVSRATIAEALWMSEEPEEPAAHLPSTPSKKLRARGGKAPKTRPVEVLQQEALRQAKSRLVKCLEEVGLSEADWLDSRRDGALRLRSEVQSDLKDFQALARFLEAVRWKTDTSVPLPPQLTTDRLRKLVARLHRLYRDGFAEQFELLEWTRQPREHYRSTLYQALQNAAVLLGRAGDSESAIDLAVFAFEQHPTAESLHDLFRCWELGDLTQLRTYLREYEFTNAVQLAKLFPELAGKLAQINHLA